jgi:hypothetical protein
VDVRELDMLDATWPGDRHLRVEGGKRYGYLKADKGVHGWCASALDARRAAA